jgi:hypothetical protein
MTKETAHVTANGHSAYCFTVLTVLSETEIRHSCQKGLPFSAWPKRVGQRESPAAKCLVSRGSSFLAVHPKPPELHNNGHGSAHRIRHTCTRDFRRARHHLALSRQVHSRAAGEE